MENVAHEIAFPAFALAGFLIFATLRGARHFATLSGVNEPLDLRENLETKRRSALQLERFIYLIYMPILGIGVMIGLWLALYEHSVMLFWGALAATLAWIAFTGWWGRKRQKRKIAKLDEILKQLEGE